MNGVTDWTTVGLTIFTAIMWIALAAIGLFKGEDWAVFCAFCGMLWWALEAKQVADLEHDIRRAVAGWSAALNAAHRALDGLTASENAAACCHPWRGEGPAPAHWWCCGVKVYRDYAAYCDD